MKFSGFLSPLLLANSIRALAESSIYTQPDFTDFIKAGKWHVYYYEDDCLGCSSFETIYKELLDQQTGTSNDMINKGKIQLHSINCSLERSLCTEQSVENIPAIHAYFDGKYKQRLVSNERKDVEHFIKETLEHSLDGGDEPAAALSQVQHSDNKNMTLGAGTLLQAVNDDYAGNSSSGSQQDHLKIGVSGAELVDDREYIHDLAFRNFAMECDIGLCIVNFLFPGNRESVNFEPLFKKLATEFIENKYIKLYGFKFYQINCEKNQVACHSLNVDEHPAVKIFDDSIEINSLTNAKNYEELLGFVKFTQSIADGDDTDSFKAEADNGIISLVDEGDAAVMILFYKSSCHSCDELISSFYEIYAKSDIELFGTDLRFKIINCDKHKDLCKTHEIVTFPTIKAFSSGELTDIYLTKDSETLKVDALKVFIESFRVKNDMFQRGLFGTTSVSSEKIKEDISKLSYGIKKSLEEKLLEAKVLKDLFEDSKDTIHNDDGRVIHLNDKNYESYTMNSTFIIGFHYGECSKCLHLKKVFKNLASDFRYQLNVGLVDCKTPSGGRLCRKLGAGHIGVEDSVLSQVIIRAVWRGGRAIKRYDGCLETSCLANFARDYRLTSDLQKDDSKEIFDSLQAHMNHLSEHTFLDYINKNKPFFLFIWDSSLEGGDKTQEISLKNELFLRIFKIAAIKSFMFRDSYLMYSDSSEPFLRELIISTHQYPWSKNFGQSYEKYLGKQSYNDFLSRMYKPMDKKLEYFNGEINVNENSVLELKPEELYRAKLIVFRDGMLFNYYGDITNFENVVDWVTNEAMPYVPRVDKENSLSLLSKSKYTVMLVNRQKMMENIGGYDNADFSLFSYDNAYGNLTKIVQSFKRLELLTTNINKNLVDNALDLNSFNRLYAMPDSDEAANSNAKPAYADLINGNDTKSVVQHSLPGLNHFGIRLAPTSNNGDQILSFVSIDEKDYHNYLDSLFWVDSPAMKQRAHFLGKPMVNYRNAMKVPMRRVITEKLPSSLPTFNAGSNLHDNDSSRYFNLPNLILIENNNLESDTILSGVDRKPNYFYLLNTSTTLSGNGRSGEETPKHNITQVSLSDAIVPPLEKMYLTELVKRVNRVLFSHGDYKQWNGDEGENGHVRGNSGINNELRKFLEFVDAYLSGNLKNTNLVNPQIKIDYIDLINLKKALTRVFKISKNGTSFEKSESTKYQHAKSNLEVGSVDVGSNTLEPSYEFVRFELPLSTNSGGKADKKNNASLKLYNLPTKMIHMPNGHNYKEQGQSINSVPYYWEFNCYGISVGNMFIFTHLLVCLAIFVFIAFSRRRSRIRSSYYRRHNSRALRRLKTTKTDQDHGCLGYDGDREKDLEEFSGSDSSSSSLVQPVSSDLHNLSTASLLPFSPSSSSSTLFISSATNLTEIRDGEKYV